MKLKLITVGKLENKNYHKLFELYLSRIKHYVSIEHAVVKPERIGKQPPSEILKKEGERILGSISPKDFIIALDKQGNQFGSEEFSTFLQNTFNKSSGQIIFIIGGPLGIDANVLQRADVTLALSRMTFPHELATVILAEQIYRGLCILHGGNYHK